MQAGVRGAVACSRSRHIEIYIKSKIAYIIMSVSISKSALPIIKESVEREIALMESKMALIEKEISSTENKYNLSSKSFIKKFEKGELGDNQDYFEWWGLIEGLKKLKKRLDIARTVASSW